MDAAVRAAQRNLLRVWAEDPAVQQLTAQARALVLRRAMEERGAEDEVPPVAREGNAALTLAEAAAATAEAQATHTDLLDEGSAVDAALERAVDLGIPCTTDHLRALTCGTWHARPLRFVPKLRARHRRQLAEAVTGRVEVRASSIAGAGRGVFAVADLPAGSAFPYLGVVYPACGAAPANDYLLGDGCAGVVNGAPARAPRTNNVAHLVNEPCTVGIAAVWPAAAPPLTAEHVEDVRERLANMDMVLHGHPEWNDVTPTVLVARRGVRAGEELVWNYGACYEPRSYPTT